MRTISVTHLAQLKRNGEKIACLTAYDSSFARLLDEAGVDVLLVGDSLGMVMQGRDTTLEVSVGDIIYHTACVTRVLKRAFVIADMPFMSYAQPVQALGNAARMIREGGAQMVKVEGGAWLADTVALLSQRGIPVCAHLGLTPQSIHKLGGYRVQGRDQAAARTMQEDARILQQAGAEMLVLECVPAVLAEQITRGLSIPVIGIGAGWNCDGQVLVLQDMLGISPKIPGFCKNYLAAAGSVTTAVRQYVSEVKEGTFPGPEHIHAA